MTDNENDPMTALLTKLMNGGGAVRISKPKIVAEKLRNMKRDGASHLQVISDFDYTFSRHSDKDGSTCWTSHQVFDQETMRLDPVLGQKLMALRDYYMPIEFSPTVPREEKKKFMVEWWTTAHDHIVSSNFTKHMLEDMVNRSNIKLRDDAVRLVFFLEQVQVPVQLFSAGIGDIIDIALHNFFQPYPSNLCLISNLMQFSDPPEERIIGFKEPLIHTFNKNSSVVSAERLSVLKERKNVLLMGDTIGDSHMDDGVIDEGIALKIGFLNARIDSLLEQYMDTFDVVLINDQTMHVPLALLTALIE